MDTGEKRQQMQEKNEYPFGKKLPQKTSNKNIHKKAKSKQFCVCDILKIECKIGYKFCVYI